MARDVVSRKMFDKIVGNRLVKPMREQSVREAISNIHQKNHGITMNAAAYVFAKSKGFGMYGYLSPDDKLSLQYLKAASPPESNAAKPRARAVAVKDIKADFESPFIGSANANAKAYPYIYILENTLRQTILERFEGKPDWWKDQAIVKKEIQEYAARIQEAEKKYQIG